MVILAALSFHTPVMLVGLLAAGIPVVLHLLNRVRSPIVQFPTLRFLKITAMKTSRRRQLQHWLLLLLRMAVFALIAVGVAQPQVWGGSSGFAYVLILAFLAGVGLLVYAILRIATQGESKPQGADDEPEIVGRHVTRDESKGILRHKATHWATSLATLLAAILLLGYSVFGLGTDTYFSGPGTGHSGQSTAAVIILDNSQSMLARLDSASRLDRAKEQVRQLLLDQLKPAEAALLATNPGTIPPKDHLTTNVNEILGYMNQLQSVGRARPMRQCVREAATTLAESAQPNKMLIIISDMQRNAFSDPDVFALISLVPDVQMVLMPQATGAPPRDAGIVSFTVASGQAVIGNQIVFEAQVLNNADAADVRDLQMMMDDQVLPEIEPKVQLGPAGSGAARATIKIPYRLTAAGSHRFTLKLKDSDDAMAWDDQRDLVLNVADEVNVLVIGPEQKLRARSTSYFVETALNPFAGDAGVGSKTAWGIAPAYRGVAEAGEEQFAKYAAVFMCDVPRVPTALADTLKKYADGGGRICWLLGPAVDAAAYNQEMGSRELLPGVLTNPVVSAVGSNVDWIDTQDDVFADLFESQDPFRQIVVTGRWGIAGNTPQHGRVLGKLQDGSVFMTEHLVDDHNGEIYTLLTANTADWSNMGTTVTFLPMLVRIALGDLQHVKNNEAVEPGALVDIDVPTQDKNVSVDVVQPSGGAPINVVAKVVGSENPRWIFNRTLQTGAYLWRSADSKFTGEFVVNPPAEEVDLTAADADVLARQMHTKLPAIVAPTAAELISKLQTQSEALSLAPGMLAFVLMLAVLEALFANRHKPGVQARMQMQHKSEVPALSAA